METIGIAVIGCGSTAQRRHLPTWQALAPARLAAVASRDAARRDLAMSRFGAVRAVADWRELLQDPEVQAFDICLPHPLHAEVACAALASGRHVLCEKPLAIHAADARRMRDAAQAAGRVLMPFHNMRLMGPVARAIRAVRDEGSIGRPVLIRAVMAHGGPDASDPQRRWFYEPSAGGGAILDLGPHVFDVVGAMLHPLAPQRLRAVVGRSPTGGVETDGLVEMVFPEQRLAQFTLSWSMVGSRESAITVQGTEGHLQLRWGATPGQPTTCTQVRRAPDGTVSSEVLAPDADAEPCAAFLDAIRGNARAITAEDGIRVVDWIERAYRSAEADGAWISV